ncbi:hypothetical protein QAD02_013793 [Eretmocerus hayati]|uniref:Uncharacterized protein n=1 Tax=Eretmocerus hayati TaxID=131215 RepID=A0ACC2P3K4_9HYME|nr:hypothetical protein QAD02_013793 [Eretmocerus hayati]
MDGNNTMNTNQDFSFEECNLKKKYPWHHTIVHIKHQNKQHMIRLLSHGKYCACSRVAWEKAVEAECSTGENSFKYYGKAAQHREWLLGWRSYQVIREPEGLKALEFVGVVKAGTDELEV